MRNKKPELKKASDATTDESTVGKSHKETAAANVTNMCLRPLNGGARVTIISLRPR